MVTKQEDEGVEIQFANQAISKILQDHFKQLYRKLAEMKLIPNARYEKLGRIQRCLSGIPVPFHNALFGCPAKKKRDLFIEDQLDYFRSAKMPFVWYLNEDSNPEFKQQLIEHGFQDGGIFQGVIGSLKNPIPIPDIGRDCVLELVQDESSMAEFNELVCATFGIQGVSKELYKQFSWHARNSEDPRMNHWIARKKGEVVSAVSTFMESSLVSFWNGATLPQFRRQGISTALRCLALQDAVSKECRVGASYLMSEAMAFGICKKLGFQTKWRFNVYLSPSNIII